MQHIVDHAEPSLAEKLPAKLGAARKVLIIEDHPFAAEAMREFLTRTGFNFEIELSSDAESAISAMNRNGEQLFRIFLDLDVPGAIGLSLAREVKRKGLHIRCCILTALNRAELISEVKHMGFLGYVIKASPYRDWVADFNSVVNGITTFPKQIDSQTLKVIRLTRRQEQLLDGVRRGLTSKRMADVFHLSAGTIDNTINGAMRALDVTSRSHAVAKAIELGLLNARGSDD